MIKIIFALSIVSAISCLSFHPLAKHSLIVKEDSYIKVLNSKAQLASLTFGDFKFATNSKAFKKMNKGQKPPYRHIIYYAKTEDPSYDYYVLYDTNCTEYDSILYDKKDTIVQGKKLVVLVSKMAPETDKTFIMKNIAID